MTPGRGLSPAAVPLDEAAVEGGDCVLLPGLPIDDEPLSGDWGDRGRPGDSGDGGSDISEHSDRAP